MVSGLLERTVAACSRRPGWVLAAALLLAGAGAIARRAVPRDLLPELADPHLGLVAEWMGHAAPEVAARLTRPLSSAAGALPGVTAVRGTSMQGMAYLDLVFSSPAALRSGRQALLERLPALRASLPAQARLTVGPEASSTGWVYQYALVDPTQGRKAIDLRRFHDQVLRPALAAVPGVAEVASVGGDLDELTVNVSSEALRAEGLALSDVVSTLHGALARAPETGLEVATLASLTVAVPGREPVPLSRVAQTTPWRQMAEGLADLGGTLPAVGGIVVARPDVDVPSLVAEVRRRLVEQLPQLGPSVRLVTVHDRSQVIGRIQGTLGRALAEEVAVVVLTIFLFLLHARSAVVPLLTLPLVVLLTYLAMWVLGLPATVMSLGGIGIALGLAVDADVVALEACHRRLEGAGDLQEPGRRRDELVAAAGMFGPAVLTALLITALSFLPVFAFAGETGRLLRPLALTKTLVIAAAALVSLTVAPALRTLLLRGRVRPEFDNPLNRTMVRLYRPFVGLALRRPALTLAVAGLALLSTVPVAARLGGEFLPRIDEGDLLFMPSTLPGAPPHELAAQLALADRGLAGVPEVETVFGKAGRASTATDPAPLSMVETTLQLRPPAQWPLRSWPRWYSSWAPAPLRRALGILWPEVRPATRAELLAELDAAARLPGWTSAWTAPARGRLDMVSTGIRTPVGVRIVAADPARRERLGGELGAVLVGLPGTRAAVFESPGEEPWLTFHPDATGLARLEVDPRLAEETAELLVAGGELGTVRRGDRAFRLHLAEDLHSRGPADQLRAVAVRSRGLPGQPVPLGLLGDPVVEPRRAVLRSEGAEDVAYLSVDLAEGTDLLGYVQRGKEAVLVAQRAGGLLLGPGERMEWVGEYPILAAASRRLGLIVPAVLLAMLALLYWQFRSLTEALIVLTSVPFALVGSVWMLYWLGYPLSAPVWVGLLAVAGLAMQTAVVMVVYIDAAFYRRLAEGRLRSAEDVIEAHAEGTVRRLRPKLMTVTTMAAGLLPLLWADGAGAEVMRRIAAPMIGGLLTSAFLTLEVLPVLYTLWRCRQLERARRLGAEPVAMLGSAPAWARRPL